MAEVITKENYNIYKAEGVIDEMHKQRFRTLFSDDDDSQKWDAAGAGSEPGDDRDAYDHDDTIYLIERHPETNDLVASVRFCPTMRPHLMSDVFAEHCSLAGLQRGPKIWECSRLVYDRSRMDKKTLFGYVRPRLRLAIVDFCIESGFVEQIVHIVPEALYVSTLEIYPDTMMLGPVMPGADGIPYVAAKSHMNERARDIMRGLAPDVKDALTYRRGDTVQAGLGADFARVAA